MEQRVGNNTLEGDDTASSAVPLPQLPRIQGDFGRIVRDRDGNVVGVELDEELHDVACGVPEIDGVVQRRWVTEMGCADGGQREDQRSFGVIQGKTLSLIGPLGAQSSPAVQFTQFEPREEKKTKTRFRFRNNDWLHSARCAARAFF